MAADVKLIVGINKTGSYSIIDEDMRAVVKHISDKNYKIKFGLDTRVKTSWTSQISNTLSEISKSGNLSIKVSEIKIGEGALNNFKKQLEAVVNSVSLDKGYNITLNSKQTGTIASDVNAVSRAASDAAENLLV